MTFWTLPEDEVGPAVTLCEAHALEATNIGAPFFGFSEPFTSMQEAASMLDAAVAMFGNGKVTEIGFTSSELGKCDECEAQRGVA